MKRNRILTISIEVSSRDINKQVLTSTPKVKKSIQQPVEITEIPSEYEFNFIFFMEGKMYCKVNGQFTEQ